MIQRLASVPEEGVNNIGDGRIRIVKHTLNKDGDDDGDEEDLIMQNIKHSPYDDEIWSQNSEANALGKYDDFHTIDWSRDRMRDRIRFRQVKKMKYQGTLWEKIKVFIFLIHFYHCFQINYILVCSIILFIFQFSVILKRYTTTMLTI